MSGGIKLFEPSHCPPNGVFVYLSLPSRGQALHNAVRNGLDVRVLRDLAVLMDSNIRQVADCLDISRTTLYRRLKLGRFSSKESDAIVRMAEVLEAAVQLFDDDSDQAIRWMRSSIKGLDNKSPLDSLQTNVESQAVIELIHRLEHGVFS